MTGLYDGNRGKVYSRIHILNVAEGDCTLIEHSSGRKTLIDICCGNIGSKDIVAMMEESSGNYRQKEQPTNPIVYLKSMGIDEIFRFVLSHPDMDHMDGIENLFRAFPVMNFWDTENTKADKAVNESFGYKESDWEFYKDIREADKAPKVLRLSAGARGKFYNEPTDLSDDIYILSPSKDFSEKADKKQKYNDLSYVLEYKPLGWKFIFPGDSEKAAWDCILGNDEFKNEIANVDLLLAPHHGRESGGNKEYLDTLNPQFIVIGNALSQYLDYDAFNKYDHITKNQAGNILIDIDGRCIQIYISNGNFVQKVNADFIIGTVQYYFYKEIRRR